MTEMQTLPQPSPRFERVADVALSLGFDAIPSDVSDFASWLVLDLIGVAAAATRMSAGQIARDTAVAHWAAGVGAPAARLLFDGRRSSLAGAAFALATQIDNLDAHDGWQPSKGHGGAAIFPALCALAEASPSLSGREAIAVLVAGYEIAYRAAAALHATVPEYHTSGAWNAVGTAAIAGRLLGLSRGQLRHALGIAEFHAPRSQMMREIANPSMLHDGTSWGAPTGIMSAFMAGRGFTGAPAALVEFDDASRVWEDLGRRWLTAEQYIKHYPVCRWAHAPIDAVLRLRERHDINPARIRAIEIDTFKYSAELWNDVPGSSAVAQYSLAWPVAAAAARGRVTVDEVLEASFTDPEIRRLTAATTVRVEESCERAYPEKRIGGVTLVLDDGSRHASGLVEASGGPVPRPRREEVIAKYRAYAMPVLGERRALAVEAAALGLTAAQSDFKSLLDLICPQP